MADATTGTYVFRHALLQEAVYGDLLPSEQVRLHAAYASLLAAEPEGAAAELAHHCLASHDLAGALAASVRAAEESAAVLAPAETLRHLSGALKLWERVPDPAAVTGTDRIDLTAAGGRGGRAAGDEHRAAGLAQDAAAIADATADPAGRHEPMSASGRTSSTPAVSRRRCVPRPVRWRWCPPSRPPGCGGESPLPWPRR